MAEAYFEGREAGAAHAWLTASHLIRDRIANAGSSCPHATEIAELFEEFAEEYHMGSRDR